MSLALNNLFEMDARAAVEGLRKAKMDQLALGTGIDDFEAYRQQVGYLRALHEVEEALADVHAKIEKR